MGKVMSHLKEKYSTNMDFSKASKFLKETLFLIFRMNKFLVIPPL